MRRISSCNLQGRGTVSAQSSWLPAKLLLAGNLDQDLQLPYVSYLRLQRTAWGCNDNIPCSCLTFMVVNRGCLRASLFTAAVAVIGAASSCSSSSDTSSSMYAVSSSSSKTSTRRGGMIKGKGEVVFGDLSRWRSVNQQIGRGPFLELYA